MTWLRHRDSGRPFQKHSILLAGVTTLVATGSLYLIFGPAFAGADRKPKTANGTRLAVATRDIFKPSALLAVPNPTAALNRASEPAVAATTEADRIAMLMSMALLEQGRRRLAESPDYTCTFYKQERIGSELSRRPDHRAEGAAQALQRLHEMAQRRQGARGALRRRHGRQPDDRPSGRLERAAGPPASRSIRKGSLAMSEARHPVTMVGLVKLCDEIISRRKSELEHRHPVRCRLIENEIANDRPCYCFVSTYLNRKSSEEYRKSIQYIDKESAASRLREELRLARGRSRLSPTTRPSTRPRSSSTTPTPSCNSTSNWRARISTARTRRTGSER